MFPIPFNFPFRKKDGSLTTIGNEISEGGGGGGYTLPTASASTKGGVKIGEGLTMNGEVLSNDNPTQYELPVASAETLGGIKVGANLSIDENGVLSASGGGGGGSTVISSRMSLNDFPFTASKKGFMSFYIVGTDTPSTSVFKYIGVTLKPSGTESAYGLLQDANGSNAVQNQRIFTLSFPVNVGDQVQITGDTANLNSLMARFIEY